MIGYNLITHQTSAKGLPVSSVLVHEGVDIDRQIYLAFLLDRKTGGPVVVASKKGGMDIEQVAKDDPDAIFTHPIDFKAGMTVADAQSIVDRLDFETDSQREQGVE
jgi:succinyl-CoA synthetase beta subunit